MEAASKHLKNSLRQLTNNLNRHITSWHPLTVGLVLAFTVSVSGAVLSQPAFAQEQEISDSQKNYCGAYVVNSEKVACNDGWSGYDCEGYKESHDQNHVDICLAAADKKTSSQNDNSGGSNNGGNKPDPAKDDSKNDDGAGGGSGGGGGGGGGGGKDPLDSLIKDMSEAAARTAIAKLPTDPGLIPDNNYGAYVNGAGKLQPIKVSKAGSDGAPAIVFFNGGGWHTDDGTGDKIAPKANERGYTTFVASYRLGSSGIYYMLEDVLRAMRHVRNNAGMYGIDPSRLAIWGDSAGGSLAMRAAGTGQSGAKVAVGWSAPTNAFTAIFHSPQSFAIGMDHSTCTPTDLAGAASVVDIMNGGDGAAVYDGGAGNNNFSDQSSNLSTVVSVLQVAQAARTSGMSNESASKSIESGNFDFSQLESSGSADDITIGGTSGLGGGSSNSGGINLGGGSGGGSGGGGGGQEMTENVRRLATSKVIECLDNFASASPALYASALSPPAFLAGYEQDPLVHPGQAFEMRDKLRSLGIHAEALILPGNKHLGYEEEMVKPSLDFVDRYLYPDNAPAQ